MKHPRNITPVEHRVPRDSREARNRHLGGVLWFTGLSGAGKSTLAFALEEELFKRDYQVYVLDGDNVRQGLNRDLDFSPDARVENIRRVGEVAALFADAGIVCISAFISPYRIDRQVARSAAKDRFHEIYVNANIATCELRDPKGLYKKARDGLITNFTGISAPYEAPQNPELVVNTDNQAIAESIDILLNYTEKHFLLS